MAVEVAVTTDAAPVEAAVTVAAETVSGPTSASASDSGAANPIILFIRKNRPCL